MRIVHTSDWHVGRVWKNQNRLDEMAKVLDHLGRFIEHEKIDLLLMSGDVFENQTPTAESEKLVFGFFKRIGRAGTQSVVIAGNHDNGNRLDAWGMLAELVGVRTVGKPRPANKGGVQTIETESGEIAVVAALPFASVSTWVSAWELAGDETAARQTYAEMFRLAVESLTSAFRRDTVNLLMAHTHLEGAILGDSERQVHLGAEWAATAQAFPSSAHYVGLGHIHKPQRIEAPSPAYYAGSPLQLDFGEAGQEKSFLVIEAKPKVPARVTPVAYEGAKPLKELTLTLAEVEQRRDELLNAGWLRVIVPLQESDPDLARKVRASLPNAVVVHADLPERQAIPLARPPAGTPPLEMYRAFHERQYQERPNVDVETAFQRLYEQVGD